MKDLLAVAIGGAVGSVARWWVASAMPTGLPWATLTVNAVGSLLIGVLFAVVPPASAPLAWAALAVGVMGGFTTYSTYSLDTWRLAEAGQWGLAAAYALGTAIVCVLGTAIGVAIGRAYAGAGG